MHRRADDELTAILHGGARGRRPDAPGARAVLELQSAFRTLTPPRPSTELASLLESTVHVEGSPYLAGAEAVAPDPPSRTSRSWRRWAGWLTGLSLGWQLAVGSTAALAAVGGVGVAGALPGPAQDAFDRVVTTVTPFGRDADEAGTRSPTEDRSTPVDDRRPEQASGRDDGRAPADRGRDRRPGRDEPRRPGQQAVPGAGDRAGTPGAPGPGAGQPGSPGSEGAGPRTKDRADEDDRRGDEAADAAEDEAEDAADAAEEAQDLAEEAEDETQDAAQEAGDDDADAAEKVDRPRGD